MSNQDHQKLLAFSSPRHTIKPQFKLQIKTMMKEAVIGRDHRNSSNNKNSFIFDKKSVKTSSSQEFSSEDPLLKGSSKPTRQKFHRVLINNEASAVATMTQKSNNIEEYCNNSFSGGGDGSKSVTFFRDSVFSFSPTSTSQHLSTVRSRHSQSRASKQDLLTLAAAAAPPLRTPFSSLTVQLSKNMCLLQSRMSGRLPFFHCISKHLTNMSNQLKQALIIEDRQDVLVDAALLEKALIATINTPEFRQQPFAQRGMIKNLQIELRILDKDIFASYLSQQKKIIDALCEKITNERERVDCLARKLTNSKAKHGDIEEILGGTSSFTFAAMPVKYISQKFDQLEHTFGYFPLIKQENKFLAHQIDRNLASLKNTNSNNNHNPYASTTFQR